ncbi:MAG: hypothetical protein HZA61_14735 [Candidatus Eisenbacteria bacterium]|uniref:Reelin domain-containing protein n=1 Tax=Eiseniibacteriota bacterium TaxID=2212470 RepID=A0A933W9K9_UNCEI|nr:hypothetical protein [Candidatus Eisenbacteria bacterium]
MSRSISPVLAAFGATLLAAAALASTHYSSGPLPSKTGAPAVGAHPQEPTCTECPLTFDGEGQPIPNLNVASGHLSVLDLPAYYVPGRTYTLRVELGCDSSAVAIVPRWGFQLTAVDAATGATAGTFSVRDPDSMQVVHLGAGPWSDRWYVEQNVLGAHDGELGPVTWSFDWTAPASPAGSVTFYAAGNAANGSEEPSGDWIFTTSATVLDTTTAVRRSSWGAVKSGRR